MRRSPPSWRFSTNTRSPTSCRTRPCSAPCSASTRKPHKHSSQVLQDNTMRGRPAPKRTIVVDGKPLPEVLDEAMVHAVVHGFYDDIREDDLLGPIFTGHIAAQ